jgi:N-acylneuraminate cytidylyltransferase
MSTRILAVIPARGGSTRIPDKNIKAVDGVPLIAHTIRDTETATELDRVIVSTDDEQIAQVAREYGGNVPFMRPAHLATDDAPTGGAITHALEWATEQYGEFEYVCVPQVTSPLRTSEDIDAALRRLQETGAQSVVSVSAFLTPPRWAVTEDENGHLQPQFDAAGLWDDEYVRSQDIDELVHPNGAVFAATTDAWERFESFYTPETVGYEMPPERSFDIDEPWELNLVRKLVDD